MPDKIAEYLTCISQLSALVFSGSDAFILFKNADKVAQIVEAAVVCDVCDGIVGGGQHQAGLLDPLAVQIIHWCLMRHIRKEPAEIFRRHGDRGRQLLKGDRAGIILLDKIHDLFELKDPLVIPSCFLETFQIVMFTKNKTEKVVKLSN